MRPRETLDDNRPKNFLESPKGGIFEGGLALTVLAGTFAFAFFATLDKTSERPQQKPAAERLTDGPPRTPPVIPPTQRNAVEAAGG